MSVVRRYGVPKREPLNGRLNIRPHADPIVIQYVTNGNVLGTISDPPCDVEKRIRLFEILYGKFCVMGNDFLYVSMSARDGEKYDDLVQVNDYYQLTGNQRVIAYAVVQYAAIYDPFHIESITLNGACQVPKGWYYSVLHVNSPLPFWFYLEHHGNGTASCHGIDSRTQPLPKWVPFKKDGIQANLLYSDSIRGGPLFVGFA